MAAGSPWVPASGALGLGRSRSLGLAGSGAAASAGAVVWAGGLGGGLVAFGFLRVLLVHPFSARPVVGLLWEEVTEALFLVLFLYWLHRFGRSGK